MRGQQDGAARRFVDPARLHADETVFHQVEAADAVAAAELVEFREQRRGRELLAVNCDRVAALEIHRDVFGRVGRVFGADGALVDDLVGLDGRVFEHFAFRRRVQEVRVDAERRLAALVASDRDLVLLGELEELVAAGQLPLAPGRDDGDVGLECVIRDLEADLVVALAGRTVRHRVGADLFGDLDLALRDQGPCDRGAQQILPLVQRVRAEHRKDEVPHEGFAEILDEDLAHAEHLRLAAGGLELLALTEIGGEGHDLATVFGLQPAQDHARVEPARIGQDNLLHRLACHHALRLAHGTRGRRTSGSATTSMSRGVAEACLIGSGRRRVGELEIR